MRLGVAIGNRGERVWFYIEFFNTLRVMRGIIFSGEESILVISQGLSSGHAGE